MLKINNKTPVLLGLVSALALVGCEGNSSSTSIGPSAVITPIEIDKEISPVQWDSNNDVLIASHAYRAITQNTMVKTVFTNQLSSFDLLANLFRLSDVRSCKISGRMIAETPSDECSSANGADVSCDGQDVAVRQNTQVSRAIACQDDGKYFDGFFNIIKTTDQREANEIRTSTTISAVGKTLKFDENGDPVLDVGGKQEFTEVKDYLFQSEFSAFFFDQAYESYVNYLSPSQDLECGPNKYTRVGVQGIRSDEVGAFEGDGTTPYYLYTKFTDLNMASTPTATCNADNTQSKTYAYSFTATMESAAMGGGDNAKTQADWPDMEMSIAGIPSGILTLVHENTSPASTYTVTLDFNTAGYVTLTPSNSMLTLAEFLALSKPEPVAPEAVAPEAVE